MNNQFSRTIGIFTKDKYEFITSRKIIVFGTGGVGSSAIEAIVRFGFNTISFVDYDRVDESNLNRQIFTKRSNIGMFKCLAIRDRILEINPNIEINYHIKKLTDNMEQFNLKRYDFVIDAIDSVSSKLNLIEYCHNNKIPIISSMGTGNRIDANKLTVMDVFDTSHDPLSKIMRRELRKRGIKKLKVISSKELPCIKSKREEGSKRSSPFSVSFVPPVSGYLMVSELINDLMEKYDE